jgi:hypothetical protein
MSFAINCIIVSDLDQVCSMIPGNDKVVVKSRVDSFLCSWYLEDDLTILRNDQ